MKTRHARSLDLLPPTPSEPSRLDRRQFVVTAAGGLLLGFTLPGSNRATEAAGLSAAETAVGAWIRVGTDETITILVGSAEMGQGVLTGLPQIVAEELMVSWSRVKAEHAPVNAAYNNPFMGGQLTGGSMSVRGYYQALRNAGAATREMLIQAGAEKLGTTPANCEAKDGKVYVKGTTRFVTYGSVATLAATKTPPANPPLVPESTFRIIGKPVQRTDIPAKTDGSAKFGLDIRLPGMVYATIKHCPRVGGKASATPPTPPGAMGVVNLGNAVAVYASNTWLAFQGAKELQVKWTVPASAANADSAVILSQANALMANGTPAIAETAGNLAGGFAASTRTFQMDYFVPYLAHACMEVLNCTVDLKADSCEIWAPTQASGWVLGAAAGITGLSPDKIKVNTTLLGGGLGRKFELDFVTQALLVAKAIRKPVKLTWSREEDFQHDQYRPMALCRVRAGLDATGAVKAWVNRIVSPSILMQRWPSAVVNGVDSQAVDGAVNLPYALGARQIEYVMHPSPVPVGFWRSVGHSINAFVVESAIDELALAAKADPLSYRRKLLVGQTRFLNVLNTAASLGGWGTLLPAGRARGIALAEGFGSIVAQVAEISVPAPGSIRVHKVACAIDCGRAINPDSIEAQMQSGIVHGLAAALWGQVPFANGAATTRNFSNYRMLRMREMPEVSVKVIQSGGPIGGIGEPGVPPIAPAVANAYARLTGNRVRALPFFPNSPGGGDQ